MGLRKIARQSGVGTAEGSGEKKGGEDRIGVGKKPGELCA